MSDSLVLSLDLAQPLAATAADEPLRLQVRFFWENNRFRHTISLCDSAGIPFEQWSDVSDAQEADWPRSAPIQQLSREEINGQMTLLGVGQAGLSHWSVCVEPTARNHMPGFRFDFACRVKQPPQWLGSTYQLETQHMSHPSRASCLTLHLDANEEFETLQKNSLQQVALRNDDRTPAAAPKTYRWSYVIHPSPPL